MSVSKLCRGGTTNAGCSRSLPLTSALVASERTPEDIANAVKRLDSDFKDISIDLNWPLDEKIFTSIQECVHPWRTVFIPILSIVELDDIDKMNLREREKRIVCLQEFKKKSGSDATYKALIWAMLNDNQVDRAEKLCRFLYRTASNIESPPTSAETRSATRKVEFHPDNKPTNGGLLSDLWGCFQKRSSQAAITGTVATCGAIACGIAAAYFGWPNDASCLAVIGGFAAAGMLTMIVCEVVTRYRNTENPTMAKKE